MRGARELLTVLCIATGSLPGCTRQQPEETNAPDAAPSAAPSAVQLESQPEAEAPAQSALSIKRGIAMLAQDRATFRPCNEKAELWMLDQTDGVLMDAFAAEVRNGPAMLYIEAYGERGPVPKDIPAARAYAGTFALEEVLYAGVQSEVRGCDTPEASYIVAARGSEPFWSVEVAEGGLIWRQAQEPKEITLGPPQTQDAEGAARYHASGSGHELDLMIDAQACREPMSGEFFAYAAKAVFDGKEFSGCARVGQ